MAINFIMTQLWYLNVMEYFTGLLVQCGFLVLSSSWWNYYLSLSFLKIWFLDLNIPHMICLIRKEFRVGLSCHSAFLWSLSWISFFGYYVTLLNQTVLVYFSSIEWILLARQHESYAERLLSSVKLRFIWETSRRNKKIQFSKHLWYRCYIHT